MKKTKFWIMGINIFLCLNILFIQNLSALPFSGPTSIPGPGGVFRSSIVLGDINNDGYLDLIVTGDAGSSVRHLDTYINDTTGNLVHITSFGPPVMYSSIALGDINNDGYLDLIVTGNRVEGAVLNSYTNNGAGISLTPQFFGIGVMFSSIIFGDIDNDGDLDLIVSGDDGFGGNRLDRYFNDGTGDFSGPDNIGTGVDYSAIALGDIDLDGDLDLIVSGTGANLTLYTNNGTGTFSMKKIFGISFQQSSIAFGDIDNDDDLDFIVSGSGHFDSYTNNGTGDFSMKTNIGTVNGTSSIVLGDTDNDGDIDLIVAGSGYFESYTNDGNGVYKYESTIISGGLTSPSIALGDMDNDGDLDLIITGLSGTYRLDYYINTESTPNNPPSIPSGMSCEDVGGCWRFKWNASSDAITHQNMLRYKIAIGTNSGGVYNYSSANIDYPRGQANIGNVPLNTACYYQSKIPVSTTTYWKVCCIDSAFINSAYCNEQIAPLPQGGTGAIQKTDYSKNKIGLFPNYIGPNDVNEIYINLKGLNDPEPEYKVIISSIAGNVIRDLGTISYSKLNKGIKYALQNENNKNISTGLYIVLIVGKNERFVKKLYVKR